MLLYMVPLAVFTYDYTIGQQMTIQATYNNYIYNRFIQLISTIVIYPLFENI